MSIKEWLCGKKLKKEETLAKTLSKTGRIAGLEGKVLRLETSIRNLQSDMNRFAARITILERKRRTEKKNA